MADFYRALVEAFKIAEVHDDNYTHDDAEWHIMCQRGRIVGIISELAESEKGRAGVVAAGALLAAFMIEIARSDGLINSLEFAETTLKLSKSEEGREWLVAAGSCGALAQARRIDESNFEFLNHDCRQDFWDLERCIKSAFRKLRNNRK